MSECVSECVSGGLQQALKGGLPCITSGQASAMQHFKTVGHSEENPTSAEKLNFSASCTHILCPEYNHVHSDIQTQRKPLVSLSDLGDDLKLGNMLTSSQNFDLTRLT